MSSHFRKSSGRAAAIRLALVAILCSVGAAAAAQDQPAPKWELFGGYSFFYPGAGVHGILPGGVLPVDSTLESNPRGVGAGLTYDFTRWLGLTVDASGHWGSGETGLANRVDDAAFYNISAGPKVTFRTHHFSPFLEALAGGHRLTPDIFHKDDRFGFMGGGGLDLNLNRHFALRLLRADYVYSHHHFGSDSSGRTTEVGGVRLQSGLVFTFGGARPMAPQAASIAPPPPPAPPVAETIQPPTVTCDANPSTVSPGDSSAITANGMSPQNRPLTYTYSSTAGSVSGSGPSATLSTAGAPAGTITVTCSVVDDKAQTASKTTSVTVKAPVVAPRPMTSKLCSVSFERDARRPARVDNEAKGCLDDIALSLQHSADASLAIVGNAGTAEKNGKRLASERAANTRAYLVTSKGIDASRIAIYTGSQDQRTASSTLIPAGATFDTAGDTPVDEGAAGVHRAPAKRR